MRHSARRVLPQASIGQYCSLRSRWKGESGHPLASQTSSASCFLPCSYRVLTFPIPGNLNPPHCSVVVLTSASTATSRVTSGPASTARMPSKCPPALPGGPMQPTHHRLLELTCPSQRLYHLGVGLAACYRKPQITAARTLGFSCQFPGVWR